jgi:hypothetical protein
MADQGERASGAWKSIRRGAGWATGFLSVLGGASVLTRGSRPLLKGAMKGLLRMREAGAEGVERLRDVHAEAECEYRDEVRAREDASGRS